MTTVQGRHNKWIDRLAPHGVLGLRCYSEDLAKVMLTMPPDLHKYNAEEALYVLALWCRDVHGVDVKAIINGMPKEEGVV